MTVKPDTALCGYCNNYAKMADPLMWKDPKRCLHCDLYLCPGHMADDLEYIEVGNIFACCFKCNKLPHGPGNLLHADLPHNENKMR
ncbi:MAG: hypothetical protein L0H53_00580 [Candidatus Nitrosocosmicus sp.]|nr:hypothetical protein [Candidatus Nitrosocosmicus sp.]MDN5866032.1 hypothetical protein [Candidatus Nitrosocosmicus sp.]